MSKKALIEAIEAYATAKATGNMLLLQGAAGHLTGILKTIPDDPVEAQAATEPEVLPPDTKGE